MKNALHLNDLQTKLKTQEILSLCTLVCENLDELHGPYADLGLDVAIDTNSKGGYLRSILGICITLLH